MVNSMNEAMSGMMIAPAIILKRWETNLVFDGFPQIRLLVEVQPALQMAFTAEIKTVVDRSRMALLKAGAVMLVSYDPVQPARISIASLPDPDSLPELDELDELGE